MRYINTIIIIITLKEYSVILKKFFLDMNQKIHTKAYFWNSSRFQICTYKLYMIMLFHCYIDSWVKLIVTNDNLCENWCHFTPEWFQFNSFGEICFLKENYK